MADSHHTKIVFIQLSSAEASAKAQAVLRVIAGALKRVRAAEEQKKISTAA